MTTDPARIQRIAAAVHECAASWEPGARLVGNVTAAEIRELAIAASQAVAPPEPVAEVVWRDGPDCAEATVGPLDLDVYKNAIARSHHRRRQGRRDRRCPGVARLDPAVATATSSPRT